MAAGRQPAIQRECHTASKKTKDTEHDHALNESTLDWHVSGGPLAGPPVSKRRSKG